MGPNHPPRHPTENGENEDNDVREYENDGWRVGFEVQMNGIGHEQEEDERPGENDEGDSSGWESDPPSEDEHEAEPNGDDEKYTGYQVISEDPSGLPEISQPQNGEDQIEDDSTRGVDETPATTPVSPRIRAEFAILRSTPAVTEKFSIEHQPRPIELDNEKIESIRSTMAGFTLPPPPKWENSSVKEVNLTKILETLRES